MAKSSCTAIILALLALVATLTSIVEAQNTYPIVLVHGFSGWGPDELPDYKYWGGIHGDLQKQLRDQGYTVYTAAVGPFSSNWDRACELYAQIKGGQVDYGHVHSTKHKHERYGRNYTGLYPEWGNTVNGKVNKIHLIGHSMGGQTIRMLAHMLEKGTAGAPEVETDPTSPLFAGGKSWVHSITTIATPNQGTTLADGFVEIGGTTSSFLASVWNSIGHASKSTVEYFDDMLARWGVANKDRTKTMIGKIKGVLTSTIFKPLINRGLPVVAVVAKSPLHLLLKIAGVDDLSTTFKYEVKLEQWGIRAKERTETVTDYLKHVFSSNIFKPGFKDISLWSLSTAGAMEENSWVTTLPEVYYYSYSTMDTVAVPMLGSLPILPTMLPLLYPLATFIGTRNHPDSLSRNIDWQPNDGVVNTISMEKDTFGSAITFDGKSVKGKWNKMTQLNHVDHLAIVGTTLHPEVPMLYEAMAQLLTSLPADGSAPTSLEEQVESTLLQVAANESITSAILNLRDAATSIQKMSDLKQLCARTEGKFAETYCNTMFSALPTRRLRG